jgi:hypothetical protein
MKQINEFAEPPFKILNRFKDAYLASKSITSQEEKDKCRKQLLFALGNGAILFAELEAFEQQKHQTIDVFCDWIKNLVIELKKTNEPA